MTLSKFVLAAALVGSTIGFARSPVLDNRVSAANALMNLIQAKTDADLESQIQDLTKQGKTADTKADVAFLSGSCGVAGCWETYFVSLGYRQRSINAQSSSVAAIVRVLSGNAKVTTVLAQDDLTDLMRN